MPLSFENDAFDRVPKSSASLLLRRITWLWEHRHELDHKRLRHDLNPYYKRRVGDFHIISAYDAAQDEMVIHLVGLRDDICKQA